MTRRQSFIVILAIILALVIGLTVFLIVVQTRYNRILGDEVHAATALEGTYQASILLDRQREALATSVYLPLDRASFTQWTADFQLALQLPNITNSPEDIRQIQQINAAEQQFTRTALAMPANPTPLQVQLVRNLAEGTEGFLQTYRTTHVINLSELFSTEQTQRELTIVLLIFANGAVLVLILAGFFFLSRLGELQGEALALRETDKMRRDFVSFAAHELRNPASAIKTGASMLSDVELEPVLRAQIVESINRSADALSRVVLNLLNIGRIEAGELHLECKPIVLKEMIDELIAELDIYHPDMGTRVQQNLPDAIVDVDEEFVKLALSNMLDNAVKYSPPGSPIYICGENGDYKVIIHVRDLGTGVPPELLPQIFDKYETSVGAPYTTRRGVGLGLYMSRLLIEAHGGAVWAESVIGHGTTISFSLPRAQIPPS